MFRSAAFLWMCGAGLRLSLLALPPVVSQIQKDLNLSGAAVGVLSGLPIIVFAIFAVPGSLLIFRVGIVPTLVGGLLITAIGSALRALVSGPLDLYMTTGLMSIGIALMQPAMTAAVREWMPERPTFGTAIYTNGLIVGEIVPVAFMIPVVLPLLRGDWRLGLAVWSTPLVVIALGVALFCPRRDSSLSRPKLEHWWPDWSSKLNWRIGLMLGSVVSTYFCVNIFLPAYLTANGQSDLVSVSLTTLNIAQIPTSVLLVIVADHIQARRWPYVVSGFLFLISITGILFTNGPLIVVWAGLIGLTCGAALGLCLALSPLLCDRSDDVARTSSAAFVISFGFGVLISVASGVAWDIGGAVIFAFLPIVVGMLPIVALSPTLSFNAKCSQEIVAKDF